MVSARVDTVLYHNTAVIQIFVVNSEICVYFETGRSRSPKVVDFVTNRKCVCNVLLVINSNLGPVFNVLPRVRDRPIKGFLLFPHEIW